MGGEAFGDGQAALDRTFLAQDVQHLGERSGGGEAEFGGAQGAGVAGQPGGDGEGPGIADHAAFQQGFGDALGAATRDDDLRDPASGPGRWRARRGRAETPAASRMRP